MNANFTTMHNNNVNEIVETGIAEELVELEYIDRFRNNMKKKDFFSYKIIIK